MIRFTDDREQQVPSKSPKQARTMRAAAHGRGFAKKLGLPQKVARDFIEADKRKRKGKARRGAD